MVCRPGGTEDATNRCQRMAKEKSGLAIMVNPLFTVR